MKTVQFKDQDIEKLKALADAYYQIYGDESNEERKWDFQDVDNMRIIGQDFIEIIIAYINQNA